MERRYGVDHNMVGKWAECDGGGPIEGSPGGPPVLGARENFRGRLSGVYYDEGDPPWRWYEMVSLEIRPEGYGYDTVWCEEGFIFLLDEP